MRACLCCQKELKNNQKKYCSHACASAVNKRKNFPGKCVCCGNQLDFRKKQKKFCSSSCRAKICNLGTKRNLKDITGNRYGRYIVVKRDNRQSRWICRCDCGNIKSVHGSSLKSGHIVSCGCFHQEMASRPSLLLEDLTGNGYGKLTVIRRAIQPDSVKHPSTFWFCKCDCGQTAVVNSWKLKSSHTTSCGCVRVATTAAKNVANRMYTPEEAAIVSLYAKYKREAKDRGIVFDLEKELFVKTIKQPCYYCGNVDFNSTTQNDFTLKYNGLDRIDSDKGYFADNVKSCCWLCNSFKKRQSVAEFKIKLKEWVDSAYKHIIKSNN